MRNEDQPPAAPDDAHPYDELVADGPPETPEEFIEFVSGYLLSLKAIVAIQTNPLDAAQHALETTTRLIARLSPAGSRGPVNPFAPLLELVMALQTGASPSKTTLFKAVRHRRDGRPPDPPGLVLGKARAAAVMTMLMEGGLREGEAARLIAGRLQRAGVKFDRSNANPVNNIQEWRNEAKGRGHEPMNLAYRDALDRLRALITPENSKSTRQVLLKKADELAGLFG